ncbi:hypothetical protein IEO21_05649 [Rhodonia placenta]|uniref:Uncharacterized protein n=1 Tax=Rhodonia placenta TaxID=104341 RepID=A0A8H7P1J5_9APHY|nr:hypothetical protein IEO21_05649 [Postia placenta]
MKQESGSIIFSPLSLLLASVLKRADPRGQERARKLGRASSRGPEAPIVVYNDPAQCTYRTRLSLTGIASRAVAPVVPTFRTTISCMPWLGFGQQQVNPRRRPAVLYSTSPNPLHLNCCPLTFAMYPNTMSSITRSGIESRQILPVCRRR